MRESRKRDEDWAIGRLLSHLGGVDPGWTEDPDFTDNPDLVLEREGTRLACELSKVHLQAAYRWHNARRYIQFNKAEKIVIPREPDEWLSKVLQEKSGKVPNYLERASASEAWLLVHSTEVDPYDFFVLDQKYDLPLLMGAARTNAHPFSRIYVVSSTGGERQIWPAEPGIGPPPVLNRSTLLALEVTRNTVQVPTESGAGKGGVVRVNLNAISDRVLVLPPLDPARARA